MNEESRTCTEKCLMAHGCGSAQTSATTHNTCSAMGGVTCDCQGVVARNGKFQALPFAGRGDPLYLWPSDLIEETTEEPTNVMNWREY